VTENAAADPSLEESAGVPDYVRHTNLEADMKPASILPLAIMLATTSVFGQSLTQPPRIDPSKCPVGLEVEQNGSPVSYGAIAGSGSAHGPADDVDQRSQRFDFKMTNFSPHDIVNAEITAHAFSSKWRVFSVPAPTPDVWRTVDVTFDVKGNASLLVNSRSPISLLSGLLT
jgi:hypothetical protein